MRKTASVSTSSDLSVKELERLVQGWILDGDIRPFSKRTLGERRFVTDKFFWFLRDRELETVGTTELRLFLAYVNRGH